MSNFFTDSENIDDIAFQFLNEKVNWFTHMNRNELMNEVDWTCINRTGTTTNCELKLRDNQINSYEDVYIEVGKYKQLMKRWNEDKQIPLYINFFQSKEFVAVWDLRKINKMNYYPFTRIYNKGKRRWETVERYGLFPRDAMYYIYNKETDKYERQWQDEEGSAKKRN